MKRSLVVLAAGIGSRYGGLKQIEPLGPSGEFLLDYSVFDARRAGFTRVVFVIRRDIEAPFRAAMGSRIEKQIETTYVHQEMDALPPGRTPPPGRAKPWGTGHAVLCCAGTVREPFAVINADDYYGPSAYRELAAFLHRTADRPERYALVAYRLRETLSEHGTVARGVCALRNGLLDSIRETTGIAQKDGRIESDAGPLRGDESVSMNCWGFKPALFDRLAEGFERFLAASASDLKAEFYLPERVGQLVRGEQAAVEVLSTPDAWFGITNPRDRAGAADRIAERVRAGVYPSPLWV
jgi:NDP-sugar pyrophosphorylase family protein